MSINLLLVDDSALTRKVLRRAIDMAGLPVDNILEADHGAHALDILREHWIDLVFLDINMPIMNGIEFMQALQADAELKSTPVIIVSTEGSTERREELDLLGIKAYVRKPVSPEQLAKTVEEVLGAIKNES